MSNLVHNEQTKMLANAFNNLGVVSFATGLLSPLISAFLIPPSATPFNMDGRTEFIHMPVNAIGAVAFGSICAVISWSIARIVLAQLKEEEPSYPPIEKVIPNFD